MFAPRLTTEILKVLSLASYLVFAVGAAQAQAPNFNRDVAPIIFENCASCHRAGEIGPMPLTSYEEVRPFVSLISHHVANRIMPPWGADPAIGKFSNDPSLSEQEIATIVAWVEAGALEGQEYRLGELPAFEPSWRMGTPDVALKNPDAFEVLPTGRSVYQDAIIETGLDEDLYISGSEVRIALGGFTHHANVYATIDGVEHRVAGYTPGGASRNYPPGVAKVIPANTSLRLNIHYNPKGQQHVDPGVHFGFKKADGMVRQIAYTAQSGSRELDIPPNESNYEKQGSAFVFEQDSHLISLMPRMNERGKDFLYTLVFPDGSSKQLLSIPNFNYGWVFTYELAEPIAVPKGSRIETAAHWDNSSANSFNPDPSLRVNFGVEIMNGYFEYTIDGEDLLDAGTVASN